MKFIVGLGNPGEEYTNTRHNLGFMVLDELAKQCKVNFGFEKKLKAEVAMFVRNNDTLIFAKPQTFMNLSGDSVRKIMDFYKVDLDNLWVVSDDLDLEFGKIRVRVGGSSGGHNGLKDLITKAGEDFTRFRIGIKTPMLDKVGAQKFVLQKFNSEESEKLPEVVTKTTSLVLESLQEGIEHSSHQIDV